jgi:hypothetical protein
MTGALSGYNFYLLPSQPRLLDLPAILNSNFAVRHPIFNVAIPHSDTQKEKLTVARGAISDRTFCADEQCTQASVGYQRRSSSIAR